MPELAPLSLQAAELRGGQLLFDRTNGFDAALEQGCFYLAIPDDLDVGPCVRLARNFYKDRTWPACNQVHYRGFKRIDGIYFDREHFQTEHILLDESQRRKHFHDDAGRCAARMDELTRICLRNVLDKLGISPDLWGEITGGAISGNGTHWFAVSHYRPEREQLGCSPHRDTGFVTLLYFDQNGLEAATPEGWRSIDARAGHFVVNFGASLEHLTATWSRPIHAILHRVRRCFPVPGREDRFSFAAFANPPASALQYQVHPPGIAKATGSVAAFLREFNEITWRDRHRDFGIN